MELTIDQHRDRVLLLNFINPEPNPPKVHNEKHAAYIHKFPLDANWVCMLSAVHDDIRFQAAHKKEPMLTAEYPNLLALLDGITEEYGPEHAVQLEPFSYG